MGDNDAVIENMMSWHHSGFHVHIGERIWPGDQQGLENLARYIIRACFSQERMVYIPVAEATGWGVGVGGVGSGRRNMMEESS